MKPGLGLAGGGEAKDLPNFMGDFPGGWCPWYPFSTEQSEMILKGTIKNSVASPFSMMFKIGEKVHLPGVVQRPEQPWQGLGEKPILKIEEFQKTFHLLIAYHPLLNSVRQGGQMKWENEVMGQAKDCTLLTLSRSGAEQPKQGERPGGGEAASGLPTPQLWGQEPRGHVHSWTRVTPGPSPIFLISLRSYRGFYLVLKYSLYLTFKK